MLRRFWFLAAGVFAAAIGSSAHAADTLPAFRILTGAPVAPATAYSTYATRDPELLHTDGLCRDYGANLEICSGTSRPQAPEIIALAEGLKRDPNLIYEYVRNSVETEFVFGSHKGALGVIINHSGTAFDQAALMVELLKASGLTARYRYGDITLGRQQFYDWTGIDDAQAACRFLAAGAIPATVNGAGDCNVTGSINASAGVVMAHVWVEAVIGGMTYQFDPAFKPHEFRSGLDVRAAMTSATGQALSTTLQSAQTGDGGVTLSNLNQAGLNSLLAADASALATRLEARDLQSADLTTAIGGGVIKPATRPSSGWRDASLAHVSAVRATWDQIPNVFRARIKLSRRLADNSLRTYGDFYTDEIFGRKLEVDSKLAASGSTHNRYSQLALDTVPLMADPEPDLFKGPEPAFMSFSVTLRLEFDHPFVDQAYGDDVLERTVAGANPIHVMFAPGPVTPALGGKWSSEQAGDRVLDGLGCVASEGEGGGCSTFGDAMRAGLAASWLSQSTVAATIHAALANAVSQQQHSIGFFYSAQGLTETNDSLYFSGGGEVADIVSGFSLTSKTNDAARRRAALHAIAATFSVLEGSVGQQSSDSTDATSTARRFAWANAPGVDSRVQTARPFRSFAANGAGPQDTDFLVDGGSGPSTTESGPYRERLRNSVNSYLGVGYGVVAAMDAVLGPGDWAFSPGLYSNRGGAFAAARYVGAEPTEIAYVSLSFGNESKGGGLPNSTAALSQKLVDKLKDNFQDRSSALGVSVDNGLVSYESPELASVGSGEFPYRLSQKIVLRGGGLPAVVRNPSTQLDGASPSMGLFPDNDPLGGELGNDGLAAMGQARLSASAPTLAAFAAMQDIWSASPSTGRELAGLLTADWWTWRLMQNVVTFRQGATQRTFARTAGDKFREPTGGAEVTVTSARALTVKIWSVGGGNQNYVRQWCPVGSKLQYDLREASGMIHRSGITYAAASQSFCGVSASPDIGPIQIMPSGLTLTRYSGFQPENRYSAWGWRNSLGRGFINHLPYDPNEVVNSPAPFIQNCYSSISGTLPNPTTAPFVLEFKNDDGKAYRLRFRAPVKRSLTRRPDDSCKLEAVFTPGDLTTPNEQYVYDAVGRVTQALDAIAIRQPGTRKPYRFYVAEGYRGERVDPLDHAYAVETMPAGGYSVSFPAAQPLAAESIRAAKLKRNIDELGRVTETLLDGRGRTLEHDLPEHNKTRFRYDDRDNVVELRQVAKPGSNLADVATLAAWDPTWNKPLWVKDGRQNQTDFSYYDASSGGASGQLHWMVQPAVTGGQPTYTFEYLSNGLLWKKTDPKNVLTQFGYNAMGDLIEVVQDPGGLAIRSCSRYDAKGDLKETTDPRAGLTACP